MKIIPQLNIFLYMLHCLQRKKVNCVLGLLTLSLPYNCYTHICSKTIVISVITGKKGKSCFMALILQFTHSRLPTYLPSQHFIFWLKVFINNNLEISIVSFFKSPSLIDYSYFWKICVKVLNTFLHNCTLFFDKVVRYWEKVRPNSNTCLLQMEYSFCRRLQNFASTYHFHQSKILKREVCILMRALYLLSILFQKM